MQNRLTQIKAILWKNVLIGWRSKQFLRQILSVIILGIFMVLSTLFGKNTNNPNNSSMLIPFYMSMALIGYSRSVVFYQVSEKESFQKQMQNIMGISYFTYYISWLIFYLINALYVCLIMLFILYFGIYRRQSNVFQSFRETSALFFVYAVSTIGFVMFLSVFFNKAKVAAQATIFIQLLLNFMYFLGFVPQLQKSRYVILLTAFFPQVSFTYGLNSIQIKPIFTFEYFHYKQSMICLLVSGIVYLLVALYLQQVLPNSQGTNKHPLFFLYALRQKKNQQTEISQLPQVLLDSNAQSQGNSADYYQVRQYDYAPLIKLKSLTKNFGSTTAVNNLTMKFYPNQIFCLLGHNGAGKSTTINLLTGLLKPTSGDIEILGLNFHMNKQQIRRSMGLCLQFNVLYEDLKIQQHLKFYALLKGNPLAVNDINEIINKCNLVAEKGKFVKNLSGGNRRKLSLANALIGGSKIIFLDQPSSGLDPTSRRSIWDIVRSFRTPDRCLILTTHHLEEAEELSQSIGIMVNGKMVIIGRAEYIKQKFNVGYHIILNFNQKQLSNMQECKKIIVRNIENPKQDKQTAKNTLKYVISAQQRNKFSTTFQQLQKLCILQVKPSTLQDAFIKLGQQNLGQQQGVEDLQMELPNFQCSYVFTRQFRAVFLRKSITILRSFSSVVSIILPTLFILIGVIMIAVLIPSNPQDSNNYVKRFMLSYFMVWAYLFNTSSFCGDLVLEREKRFKYLSHVLGLRKLPYWSANYAFDIIIVIFPLIFFFIIMYSVGENAKFITDYMGYLMFALFFFIFALIGYSYLFSFMFSKASIAFRLFPFFNFIFFFIIPQIPIMVWPQNEIATKIGPLISPFVALFGCFFTEQMGMPKNNTFIYYFNISCLIIQSTLFLGIALYIENLRFKLTDRQPSFILDQSLNNQNNQNVEQYNGENNMNQNAQIYVKNLYKVYSNGFTAIKNNSFSVDGGEIFGLLGPNGAGKSTTFNIITAALSKTSGQVKILNCPINNGIMDIFSQFGVCPQYDSIYENMTVEQHINYVARLKGIEQSKIAQLSQYYFQLLNLTPYIKVRAGNLSGGNKRKLCVSMAMLANPKIMFFDQPSSGVDPISRRFLWKSLYMSARTKNASMILTTHTMSQAESLCSRIGILIMGKFITVGTPNQLKLRYGKGFRVLIQLTSNNSQEIINAVTQQLGQVVKVQEQPTGNGIVITVDSSNFSYSKAYNLFEDKLLQKKLIKKYEIKESTLEEVFLFLSKMQPQPIANQVFNQPWQFCCCERGVNGCQWIN